MRLGKYLDDFLVYLKAGGRSNGTLRTYGIPVRLLRQHFGDDCDIRSIDVQKIRGFCELLRRVPKNAQQRYPKLSLEAAIKKAAEDGNAEVIGGKALENYFTNLSSIFNYALKTEVIERSPMTDPLLRDSFRFKTNKRRVVFTIEELNALFRTPLYTGCIDDERGFAKPGASIIRRGRFFVPLLALWHGLRCNEACQLLTEDIKEQDRIPVMLIREEADHDEEPTGKILKTDASTRLVPIHPELLRIGFLRFVEQRQTDGTCNRLFPELPQSNHGYYSDAFGKWFSRFRKSAFSQCPKEPQATMHGFRHLFAGAMRENGIPDHVRYALGGWTPGDNQESRYGPDLKPGLLLNEIQKVCYPGLDIAHLYVS